MPFMAITPAYTVAQNLNHVSHIVGALNAVGFVISAVFTTHKITDLVGVGSFIVAVASLSFRNEALFTRNVGRAAFANLPKESLFLNNIRDACTGVLQCRGINSANARVALANSFVVIWGIRLAGYLFHRVLHLGEDKRLHTFYRRPSEGFLDRKKSFFPLKLAGFWTIQAAWAFVCLLPVTYLNSLSVAGGTYSFPRFKGDYGIRDILAFVSRIPAVTAFLGILIEAIADRQKSLFRSDPNNAKRWCDQGLWKWCRYPNYFGEMLVWWSIFGICAPCLDWPIMAKAALSPIFVTFLITQLSGIPLLELANDRKYKGNQEYLRYKKETPLLFPLPGLPLWFKKQPPPATSSSTKPSSSSSPVPEGTRVTRSKSHGKTL